MKKILMGTKGSDDMTSFLRAWGPFTMMKDLNLVRFPLDLKAYHEWSRFFDCDVLFMHRPSNQFDMALMELAHHYKIPIWVDHDDDLEFLTPDNPVYSTYNNPKVKETIQFSIKNADVLTVSGIAHQKRIRKDYNRNPILIPNTIHDRLLPLAKKWTQNNKISWRGSQSHFADLIYFQEPISQIMNEFPKIEWHFLGLCPYNLSWKAPKANIQWTNSMDLMIYYKEICNLNASIQIVPLKESYFNRVKSNLAWLDGSLAGSVVLGPDFEEWQLSGMVSYKKDDLNDFYLKLKELILNSEIKLKDLHFKSCSYIEENLLHSHWNVKRLEIINNL